MFQLVSPRRAYQVRAVCGRRIGMCGYTSVPEDGRTFDSVGHGELSWQMNKTL